MFFPYELPDTFQEESYFIDTIYPILVDDSINIKARAYYFKEFLQKRWEIIKNTDSDYTRAPDLPFNRFLTDTCNYLVNKQIITTSACECLMPTVTKVMTATSISMNSMSHPHQIANATMDPLIDQEYPGFVPNYFYFADPECTNLIAVTELFEYCHANPALVFDEPSDNTLKFAHLTTSEWDYIKKQLPDLKEFLEHRYEDFLRSRANNDSIGAILRNVRQAMHDASIDNPNSRAREYLISPRCGAKRLNPRIICVVSLTV